MDSESLNHNAGSRAAKGGISVTASCQPETAVMTGVDRHYPGGTLRSSAPDQTGFRTSPGIVERTIIGNESTGRDAEGSKRA